MSWTKEKPARRDVNGNDDDEAAERERDPVLDAAVADDAESGRDENEDGAGNASVNSSMLSSIVYTEPGGGQLTSQRVYDIWMEDVYRAARQNTTTEAARNTAVAANETSSTMTIASTRAELRARTDAWLTAQRERESAYAELTREYRAARGLSAAAAGANGGHDLPAPGTNTNRVCTVVPQQRVALAASAMAMAATTTNGLTGQRSTENGRAGWRVNATTTSNASPALSPAVLRGTNAAGPSSVDDVFEEDGSWFEAAAAAIDSSEVDESLDARQLIRARQVASEGLAKLRFEAWAEEEGAGAGAMAKAGRPASGFSWCEQPAPRYAMDGRRSTQASSSSSSNSNSGQLKPKPEPNQPEQQQQQQQQEGMGRAVQKSSEELFRALTVDERAKLQQLQADRRKKEASEANKVVAPGMTNIQGSSSSEQRPATSRSTSGDGGTRPTGALLPVVLRKRRLSASATAGSNGDDEGEEEERVGM